jgi:hypothetical protein
VCVRARVRVCVCVCERERESVCVCEHGVIPQFSVVPAQGLQGYRAHQKLLPPRTLR